MKLARKIEHTKYYELIEYPNEASNSSDITPAKKPNAK
jgi:hypothetical protein